MLRWLGGGSAAAAVFKGVPDLCMMAAVRCWRGDGNKWSLTDGGGAVLVTWTASYAVPRVALPCQSDCGWS
jgi:hypothetical protein